MKVFTCTDYIGCNRDAPAAVIVAPDRFAAAELLEAELALVGLPQTIKPEDLNEISANRAVAYVLGMLT